MIETWIMNVEIVNDPDVFERACKKLSSKRRQKMMNYRYLQDRKLCLCSGLLLNLGLKQYGFDESKIHIIESKYGKPEIAEDIGIYFNISHSGNYALCSFSDYPVGADIQKIGNNDLVIAKRAFTYEEYNYINKQTDIDKQRDRFYRLWALKESYIKVDGRGLFLSLNSFNIIPPDESSLFSALGMNFCEYELNGYYIAVCSEKSDFKTQLNWNYEI